jgi:hypothetical protein
MKTKELAVKRGNVIENKWVNLSPVPIGLRHGPFVVFVLQFL